MGLLERKHELGVFDDLVARAMASEGRVALVTGPPGIGKTALLAAMRRRAGTRMQVFAALGGELERELPFGVVRQLFEPTLRAATGDDHADLLAGAASLAAPVFAPGHNETALGTFGDVIYGLYWLCADLSEAAPLLLVIDDIHCADQASLRFLSHLARRITGLPILLITAGRAGAELDEIWLRAFGGVDVISIHPAPLSAAAVTTLVRQRLGSDADETFCAACAVASGGNPFFLTEALAHLKAEEVVPLASQVTRIARLRPQTISRAVLPRLARLGTDAVRFARALAILGATGPQRIAEFAGLPTEAAPIIVEALARDSMIADGWPVKFVHPLVHEAVYGDMSAVQRASEHKRAAHLLDEDGADAELVAAHLLATPPESDAWVIAALRRSAAASISRGAPESAVASLTRARAENAIGDERAPLDAELARAFGKVGGFSEATALFREAIELTEGQADKLALALELVFLLVRAGRGHEAVDAVDFARHLIEWDDPDLPVPVQAMLALASLVAREPPSIWMGRLDRAVARTGGNGEVNRGVMSLIAFGAAALGDRPASEVARLARHAAAGPLPQDDGGLLVNVAASALTISGDTREALQLTDRGIDNARAHGDVLQFRYLAVVRSHIGWFAGQLAEAEADANSGLADVTDELGAHDTSFAAAVLIDAMVERGAITAAAKVLDDHGLTGEWSGYALTDYLVLMARGALRLAERRPAEALRDFLNCGHMLTSGGYVNPAFAEWRAGAAAAHASLGQIAEAAALATDNLELARAFEAPRPIALALRIAGRVTSRERRLQYLAEAAELLTDSPALLERAHILVEYGAELCRAGQRDAAAKCLREGLDLSARCAAQPLVTNAKKELRLLGLRPRRTAATGRDALTASEQRVAGLAADGATNREIAQFLFITTRTVEVHLTNAYRKLNIQTRGDLMRALTESTSPT